MPALALLLCLFVRLCIAGVVDWVPSAPLPADGATASVVYLYGAQLGENPKIRVKSDEGKVSAVEAVGAGLVRFSFMPNSVSTPKNSTIKVTALGQELPIAVPVVPRFTGLIEITVDPPILASTGTATLKLRPSGTSPVSMDARKFLLRASVGTVDTPAPLGDGSWVARYTPPKGLTNPVAVVLSAADAAAPDVITGRVILPVTLRKTVSFPATPGAKLALTVGSRNFGPFATSTKGQVSFEVDLDPRERQGRLVGVNPDTSQVDQAVTLPLTIGSQLMFQPLPGSVPPGTKVPIRIAVVDETGADRIDLNVEIKASSGEISVPWRDGTLYTATWTAPATGGDVSFTGVASGGEGTTRVSLTGNVAIRVSGPPPSVSLTATPRVLEPTTTTVELVARVKDPSGTAVVGKAPSLSAEGGTATGTARDNKDGSYTLNVKRTAGAPELRVFAMPDYEASKQGAAAVVVWPAASGIRPGDATTLSVVVLDRLGVPVPDVEVKFALPVGDASVTPSTRTNNRGLARVALKAGGQAGLVAVRVQAGGAIGGTAVLLSDPAGALPDGGSDADRALLDRWRSIVPALVVGVSAPVVAVATPTASSVGGGTVATSTPAGDAATTSTSKPARTTTARPPPAAGDGPRGAAGLVLRNQRGSFEQTSNAGANLLGSAEYATPAIGFYGLQADAHYWILDDSWGGIGVEAHAGVTLEFYEVVGESYATPRPDLILGARYRYPLGPISVQGGLGFHYSTLAAFAYTSDALTSTEALGLGLPGGRLAVGFGLDREKVSAALEVAETFVPYPCDLHLGAVLDVEVAKPIAVRAGATYELQSYKVEADDGDGNADIDYRYLGIQLGAAFRF